DRPGMDMQGVGRDAAEPNQSINVGNISGDNRALVINENGVHAGVQDGDRVVADTRQPGEQGQDGLQAEDGQQPQPGQQPQQTLEQPAFPTAGDAAAANRVEEQSMEDTQQGGQNAQQAAQVAGRDAQEKPVLDGLRAENAENRAKNPPGRAQAEMSPEEIDQQQQKVNAGLPSAAGAPGYDAGEPATAGASGGREYADRARQGNRGPDRGNDGRGMGE
ncbi:MAG TPA: hypothetical protein VG497_14400, partial [Kribbella sp.]|nr:hypothetical protein [Kribbella sp.]